MLEMVRGESLSPRNGGIHSGGYLRGRRRRWGFSFRLQAPRILYVLAFGELTEGCHPTTSVRNKAEITGMGTIVANPGPSQSKLPREKLHRRMNSGEMAAFNSDIHLGIHAKVFRNTLCQGATSTSAKETEREGGNCPGRSVGVLQNQTMRWMDPR